MTRDLRVQLSLEFLTTEFAIRTLLIAKFELLVGAN